MAVQVVGRDVQDHGNLRMELLGAFQLEARNLKHRPRCFSTLVDQRNHWHADVAAHQRGQAGLLQNLAQQRGGGGLAVRAGNGYDLPLRNRASQFQFADHRQAETLHLRQFGRFQRHAGAYHNQVLTPEGQQSMAASLHHDALFEQRRNILGQRLGRAHIGDSDKCAAVAQKQGRCQTGFSQSHDQNLLTFEFHHSGLFLRLPRLFYSAPHGAGADRV